MSKLIFVPNSKNRDHGLISDLYLDGEGRTIGEVGDIGHHCPNASSRRMYFSSGMIITNPDDVEFGTLDEYDMYVKLNISKNCKLEIFFCRFFNSNSIDGCDCMECADVTFYVDDCRNVIEQTMNDFTFVGSCMDKCRPFVVDAGIGKFESPSDDDMPLIGKMLKMDFS